MQPFVLSFPRLAVNAKVLSGQGTTKPKSSAIVVNPRQVKYAEKKIDYYYVTFCLYRLMRGSKIIKQ